MTSIPQTPPAADRPAPAPGAAELCARLDAMFAPHMDDPVMRRIHETARRLAEEGRIRG